MVFRILPQPPHIVNGSPRPVFWPVLGTASWFCCRNKSRLKGRPELFPIALVVFKLQEDFQDFLVQRLP